MDPRPVLEVFDRAWPRETDSALLQRVPVRMTAEVVPLFLPPGERESALARVAAAADRLAAHEDAGSTEGGVAVVAARVWARAGSDVERLRRWAAGEGLPAVLTTDEDFRWLVLRRLATLGELGDAELEAAEDADRSLAGRLAALGVRAVRPTPEAKEWAWARLRDDADLSNYAALEVARGFWAAPDPELVRPYVAAGGRPARASWTGGWGRTRSRGWRPRSIPSGWSRTRRWRRPRRSSRARTSRQGCTARCSTRTTCCGRRWPAVAGTTRADPGRPPGGRRADAG